MRTKIADTAVVVTIVFTVLAICFVGLREWAQGLKRKAGTVESGFLIAALIFTMGHCGLIIWGAAEAGLGWPIQEIFRLGRIATFMKFLEASQVISATAISLVRVSLLLFYRRIFATPKFMVADTILLVFTVLWWLQNVIVTTVCSKPNPLDVKINYPVYLLTQAVLNLTLDIATLCLPLFVIRRMHMSRRKRFMVAGIFGLGFFCIIASIVRVVYFVQLTNISFLDQPYASTTVYCIIWAVIEPCTSVVACCLPACAPLLSDENGGLSTMVHRMVSFFSITSLGGSGSNRSRTRRHDSSSEVNLHGPGKATAAGNGEWRAEEYEMGPEDERA
jgi:hypothetical protein